MFKITIVRLLKKMRFTKIEISLDDKINTICPSFFSLVLMKSVRGHISKQRNRRSTKRTRRTHPHTHTFEHADTYTTKHTNMCTYFLTKLTIEDKVRSVHIVRSPFSRLISSHQFHHDTHQELHIGMFHLG